MFTLNTKFRLLALLLFLLAGASTALADQVTLSYVDEGLSSQTLTIDVNSSAEDLALAASLMGEDGVGLSHDPANGTGSLAEIAAAMAAAAPLFAADVADSLTILSPDDTEAIVAAVNAVLGVNTTAVLAAVHFGPPLRNVGPPFDITIIEQVPSRN